MPILARILSLSLALLAFEVREAQSLNLLSPMQFVSDVMFAADYVQKLEEDNHGLKGRKIRPIVQNMLFSFFSNIWNLVTSPNFENAFTVISDISSYFIMPFSGGYYATFVHQKYAEDRKAFEASGVKEEFLFFESTNLFKEKYWQFWGMFSRVSNDAKEAYDAQNDDVPADQTQYNKNSTADGNSTVSEQPS